MSNSITPYDHDCFTNIIGLSRIDCDCFDENTDWDESYSDLFLDEAEGLSLKMVDALKDCENDNNLWLLMDTARKNAIIQFIGDSNSKMLQEYQLSRSAFKGNIGRNDFKNALTKSNTYIGQRWSTANIVGGYAHITNINTFFSAVGVISVTVYNNLNEIVVPAFNLITSNGKTANAVDILLPMWNKDITNLEYIFIYTYDALNKPKDNEVGCSSCGISIKFDCRQPYFRSKSNKLAGWTKWVMAGNIEQDTLDFMNLNCTTGNYCNGLTVDVKFYCDLGKQFCMDEPDIYDPSFITLALAIQHMAAYKLCIDILASSNVNRYTMVAGETLTALMQLHKDKYDVALDWLVKNADISNTDCIKCRDTFKMGVASL